MFERVYRIERIRDGKSEWKMAGSHRWSPDCRKGKPYRCKGQAIGCIAGRREGDEYRVWSIQLVWDRCEVL